jgi:enterochelin esterase-like enzyme
MMFSHVVFELFESQVLVNNPLGDPATRRVPVILPPNYEQNPERRYPVLYALVGFSGRGQSMLNVKPWGLNLQDRLEQLYANGMPHAIVVLPDCFTSLGGSQYRNSSAVGNYEDYLIKELVPLVDERYRTIAEPAGRAVFGKSSGGYGAFMLAMRHPDIFSAFACHSGDMVFELCYGPDFPKAANAFSAAGGVEEWWKQFQAKENKSQQDFDAINVLAMAACYSPNPSAPLGIDLPFDLHLCERREEVWARWLACDPYELVPMYTQALRAMRLAFIDCGNRDEFNLHYSARRMRIRLNELGIAHEYQEFDAGHFNIDYRYDISLPKLLEVLK